MKKSLGIFESKGCGQHDSMVVVFDGRNKIF